MMENPVTKIEIEHRILSLEQHIVQLELLRNDTRTEFQRTIASIDSLLYEYKSELNNNYERATISN